MHLRIKLYLPRERMLNTRFFLFSRRPALHCSLRTSQTSVEAEYLSVAADPRCQGVRPLVIGPDNKTRSIHTQRCIYMHVRASDAYQSHALAYQHFLCDIIQCGWISGKWRRLVFPSEEYDLCQSLAGTRHAAIVLICRPARLL